MFLADTPQLLNQMRQALSAAAAHELRHAAHTLKSTSASVGALALAACCRSIEELAHDGALDQAAPLIPQAEDLFVQTNRLIQRKSLLGLSSHAQRAPGSEGSLVYEAAILTAAGSLRLTTRYSFPPTCTSSPSKLI